MKMNNNATSKMITLEDSLDQAVEAAQPTKEQHARAVTSYEHVGDWVCDPDGSLGHLEPRYSPQGSFVYGTVVRPLWQHEFDLDALARLDIDPFEVSSDEAYALVKKRIAEHGDLRKRMEPHPHCIRLRYKDDFHHDVTPACDDPRPGGAILIRAKPEERVDRSPWSSWKPNDAFGYARWFNARNMAALEARLLALVDPSPVYVPASGKTPLRKIVQLIKMRRNRHYKPDECPSSIMLTTMAAECYAGQRFTIGSNIEVVGHMAEWAEREGDRLAVWHPTLDDVNLAEGLGGKGMARLREFLRKYHGELVALAEGRGVHRVAGSLAKMYDASISDAAMRSLAQTVNDARDREALHVGRAGAPLVVVTGNAAADIMRQPNRPHNFHGGSLEG